MALENERKLDAYGHMEWTVGNEDWVACFDAIRVPEGISYHVVVDCESGGWIDSLDEGVIAIDDHNRLENLKSLPDYWADVCWEHYYDKGPEMSPKDDETADCTKRWAEHLDSLIAAPTPEPEDDESDHESEW